MGGEKNICRRTAVYCRVSTLNDMQDGSFETQQNYYAEYVKSRADLSLVGVYGDHGKSGRSIKGRPEFRRMIQDCEAGKIDLILTKSISRFARNMLECISTIRHLQELNVAIVFEKEGLDTGKSENELLLGILATIAQEESSSIGQNMRWSRKRHIEMGHPWEIARYGYHSVGKDHIWKIEESETKRVRLAFYMAGMCCNYAKIRAALNDMEIREGTGKVWNHTPIVNMLSSVVYIGDYLSHKECVFADENGTRRGKNRGHADQYYIEGHHEPLIGRELFYGVQKLLKHHLLYVRRTNFSDEDRELMRECRSLVEEDWKLMQECRSLVEEDWKLMQECRIPVEEDRESMRECRIPAEEDWNGKQE